MKENHMMKVRCLIAIFVSVCWGLLGATMPGHAADAPLNQNRSWLNPLRYRDIAYGGFRTVRHIEGVEMITAIASGSQMGPGDGWFHPGQGRYDWKWLADRYDADHDGIITRKEFTGEPALFERLDRNHDGVITADDFDWSDKSPFMRMSEMAGRVMFMINDESNGRISREEWQEFFVKASKGKDHITADDLRDALTPPATPPSKKSKGGPSPMLLMKGMVSGEIGSFHEGPKVGREAPEFSLKTQDGKKQIKLSDYRGKKPVILVFGSFT
jgi:hypothetical protein